MSMKKRLENPVSAIDEVDDASSGTLVSVPDIQKDGEASSAVSPSPQARHETNTIEEAESLVTAG